MNEDDSQELIPSELGTKEYWSSIYERDKHNFDNYGDVGEIWFGEDIVVRIIRWMEKHVSKESHIADLGCGNGMLLVEAAQSGFNNLIGFDYCQEAVDLAKDVIKSHKLTSIDFKVADLTQDLNLDCTYDVLIDKGTYDAISLNPNNARECRLKYLKNIFKLLKNDGYFLITSCNWTEEELSLQFEGTLVLKGNIPTPTFKFGGREGSLVSCVLYQKKL